MWPLYIVWVSLQHGGDWFSMASILKDQAEVTEHYFYHMLLEVSLPIIKERRIRFHLLKGGVSKILEICFETATDEQGEELPWY